ncbi:MAG: hypothetical protein ACYCYO_12660 [Bacilli bacterium]
MNTKNVHHTFITKIVYAGIREEALVEKRQEQAEKPLELGNEELARKMLQEFDLDRTCAQSVHDGQ